MSSEAEPDVELIQHIVQTCRDGTAERILDRSPGFSGSFVYEVDVAAPTGRVPCIVKLIPDWPEDTDLTNRVYGSGAASFPAAYALLQEAAIPLPQLYASLAPGPGLPFYCYVMERLPGDDLYILRARLDGPAQAQLQARVGHYLGTMHGITRAYDGWADVPAPPSLQWREAFFTALHMILERACLHTEIFQKRQELVQTLNRYAAAWIDPPRFVFSHGDGPQGMWSPTAAGWTLSGVIDIEDHRFTDQRFALAVYEVSMERAPLHASFWAAYQQQTRLDPTYPQFRPLFQLYVLLDWLGNIPRTQPDDIKRLAHQIVLRCTAI